MDSPPRRGRTPAWPTGRRPRRSPTQTPAPVEAAALDARRARPGSVWIAGELGLPAAAVGRVLRRHRVPLCGTWTASPGPRSPSGSRICATKRDRPGKLVHVDVNKLGKIPERWWLARATGAARPSAAAGSATDTSNPRSTNHSRAAYSEVLTDENGVTGFLRRATACFAAYGVRVERVTNNAMAYRHSGAWRDAMAVLGAPAGVHRPHSEPTGRSSGSAVP